MDKIKKFLRKLTKKEQDVFLLLFEQLKEDHKKVPDIKKLVIGSNLYRVRLGQYRIILAILDGDVEIRKITKRDDQTYKNL